jgi:enoyl-CoA hydratase
LYRLTCELFHAASTPRPTLERLVMTYLNLLTEIRGRVGIITLHRPQALNALNSELIAELNVVLGQYEADASIGAIVITGSEKAFAAGADIKEMQSKTYMDVYKGDFIGSWERVTTCRKPVIAAVSGFALGGGCELAMMCDMIICADTAKFGQPEIKLGVMPGAGGTQRLTRFVGKSKAMDMCLTGRMMDAAEAERSGLVSRVVPAAELMAEAMKVAATIAGMSLPAVMMTKESVNRSYESSLADGIRFERRVFHSMFATEDQKEGMAAFAEKRKAEFKHR